MKNWHKKLGFTVITAMLALSVTGCGKDNAPASGSVTAPKDMKKIVVGVGADAFPFGYVDTADSKTKGFDLDIAAAIVKDITGADDKIEYKEVNGKTRIPMLQNGEIDIIVRTMTITEERKLEVDFSDPYFSAGQSLLVPENSSITGIADLKGKKVIAVKGTRDGEIIKQKAPEAEVSEYENLGEAFTALSTGKGDVLTTDNAILMGLSLENPGYKLVGGVIEDQPWGIAVRKGDKEMLEAVNAALKKLKDSGEYATIYEKWLKQKPE
ncbi:transporter substrate-binding domain-containing protein [Paenibacillus sp. GSMTC-2017]|uniref:transporter substrate-binding domain-containing protein n=1 Tax=Paenibacillus sp. GSMTC-2017 TaxID=2794350 RepID=UPI0018D5AAF1|nr:transporter substrate-binding domain-containing protein [Paenibacillus sp. GSMTC-2017]MBH5318336.1 transporter substrate-binding domain-containing protein [Paenibacillus sp. GSMTC-2017]